MLTTNTVEKYIDNTVISEHAYKSFKYGFSLDITALPKHDLENFVDFMFEHDEAFREAILDKLQEHIDHRLPLYECAYKYSSGLVPRINATNGETFWVNQQPQQSTDRGAA